MATVFVRVNQVGWVHVWAKEEDFYEGEPSAVFFNRKGDPRWSELVEGLDASALQSLEKGALTALEARGLLADDIRSMSE
jgi:hypothetical protein